MKKNFYIKLSFILIFGGLVSGLAILKTPLIKLFDKNLSFTQKKKEIKKLLPLSLIPACEAYDFK